jgi:hypothetical protein
VSKCDYCKDLPGNEEICNDIGVGTSFSCSCTRDECDAVYSQDKCARKYYCPGNAYCCDIGERGIVLLLHMMQNGGVQWQNIASVSSKSLQAGVMYDFYGYARGTGITTCSIVIKRPDGTIVDQNGQLLHEYVCLDEQTAKDNKLTFTPELGRYVLEFTAATSSTPKYKRVTLVVT